jgi:antibiotic biosynthesis monooxygenase (ABM) superfamily enzyme
MTTDPLYRIVRRQVRPGCTKAYEALVAAMFDEAKRFPGYLSATMIPPESGGSDYEIHQQFATVADFDRWNGSAERQIWLERLATVADGEPQYRSLNGLDAWFAPTATAPARPAPRWKLTLVSWMGIFPTVAILLGWVAPQLQSLPFLVRVGIITGIVATLMAYVIMPRLTRWMRWWLHP